MQGIKVFIFVVIALTVQHAFAGKQALVKMQPKAATNYKVTFKAIDLSGKNSAQIAAALQDACARSHKLLPKVVWVIALNDKPSVTTLRLLAQHYPSVMGNDRIATCYTCLNCRIKSENYLLFQSDCKQKMSNLLSSINQQNVEALLNVENALVYGSYILSYVVEPK